jgi:RNA polymerase sigma factor (sigma-70 family)
VDDFGAFYEEHVGAVTSYVARRVGGPGRGAVVFDVVAETFARALERRAQYDPARGPGIAWLLGIARNLIFDAARRRRVDAAARLRLGMPPVHLDDEQLERIEARGATDLAAGLAALPDAQRDAVLRRVLAEEPYPAMAADIGCSEQVVRQRVARGLARLRRTLEERQA